jgi:enoyl-CoA hydratase
LRLILTCDRIDAAEAYRVGLVDRVIPMDDLMAEAEATVKRMLSKGGPMALRLAKEAINRGIDMTIEEGLKLEANLADIALNAQDARIGLDAWKRGVPAAFGR